MILLNFQPDLKVVKWLVRSGADVEKAGWFDHSDAMMFLFNPDRARWLISTPHQYFNDNDEEGQEEEHLRTSETEVSDIAMYLAKHGCVKNALRDELYKNRSSRKTDSQ